MNLLRSEQGLVVVVVATPPTAIRTTARELIRAALRKVLAPLLDCPVDEVPLVSQAGQGLRVAVPDRQIGVSVSHESGLSVGAVNLHSAVGVDLMRIDPQIDWEHVAREYLGPQAYQRIAAKPDIERAETFAREWVSYEASLKCHGLALDEWSPALDIMLRQCRAESIDMGPGLVGALATMHCPRYQRREGYGQI